MAKIDSITRMKTLFIPGPVLLFSVGWIDLPVWFLVPVVLISVPCSLAFFVAGMKANREAGVEHKQGRK